MLLGIVPARATVSSSPTSTGHRRRRRRHHRGKET